MALPESFVEEVRRVADIVRVISEHVALKKMGTSWKGLCPFHQEKSPSFNVRQEPAVKELLHIPDDHVLAATIVLGRPEREITKLRRNQVAEFATWDRFDGTPIES